MSSLERLRTPNVTNTATRTPKRHQGVDHAGYEIEQIGADGHQRSTVADDVAEPLKEGEDQHEEHKGDQHHGEGGQEFAQDIVIEDKRKAAAAGALVAVGAENARQGQPLACALAAHAAEAESERRYAAAAELPQQNETENSEDEIRCPHAQEGADLALPRERDAGEREEVVDEDQRDGGDEAGAFAAAPGGEPERNADQHEDKAGSREGEAFVELDAIPAAIVSLGFPV